MKFITIAIDSEKSKIVKLIEKHNLKTINIYDPNNEKKLKDLFQIKGLPRYLLIGKNGVIYNISASKPSDKELIKQISSLL